jgi:hypothetical protein
VAVAVLEADGDVGGVGDGEQIAARQLQRRPGLLLVAGEHGGHRQIIQRSHLAQRAEREQHDDVATLHVRDARAGGHRVGKLGEMLERAIPARTRCRDDR